MDIPLLADNVPFKWGMTLYSECDEDGDTDEFTPTEEEYRLSANILWFGSSWWVSLKDYYSSRAAAIEAAIYSKAVEMECLSDEIEDLERLLEQEREKE